MGSRKGQGFETCIRFPFPGRQEQAVCLKNPSIKGCYHMLWCSAGAHRQLQSFAILLLPEAKEGLMEGPSLVLLSRPHILANPPPGFSCIPQPQLLPTSFFKAPSLLDPPQAASQGQGWDSSSSVRGLHSHNNIHFHIHSVFISQMYGSVTMEKKENSEFVLKRYSN